MIEHVNLCRWAPWRVVAFVLAAGAFVGCATGPYVVLSPSGEMMGRPSAEEALAALLGPATWPDDATADAPALRPESLALAIHAEANRVRNQHGLPSLAWADDLAPVAEAHSRDMAQGPYFGHTNRQGEDATERARSRGVKVTAVAGSQILEGVGENLYLTQRFEAYTLQRGAGGDEVYQFEWKTLPEIARQAVAGWMQSPAHRANLLSPLYRSQGIGVAAGENETLFVTQNFGCAVPAPERPRLAAR